MPQEIAHVHQYRRVSAQNRKQYMCVHPKCYHRLGKHLLLGKACICNKCGVEFNLDSYALTTANPRCLNCRETQHGKEQEKRVSNLMSEHLKENLKNMGKIL